jgi:hypothetical protein
MNSSLPLAPSAHSAVSFLSFSQRFPKETIRILADYFKVLHEAFNREYELKRIIV